MVTQITLLLQREMPSWAELPSNAAEKTHAIIHDNFMEYSLDLISQIADRDTCIWALGKSVAGLSEREYACMTHDYPMEALRALNNAGVGKVEQPFQFVYISGEGADPTEKSRQMWAWVKASTILFAFSAMSQHAKAVRCLGLYQKGDFGDVP